MGGVGSGPKTAMPAWENVARGLETDIRELNVKLDKTQLRLDQMVVMFKTILDWVYDRRGQNSKRVTTDDLVDFMERLVAKSEQENPTLRESADLVSELVKKGGGVD